MGNVKSSESSAVRRTQRHWAKKLKRVKLADLKHVSEFSRGGCSNVYLVQLNGHPNSAFALKAVQKAKVTEHFARQSLMLEKKIHGRVRSDFIAKLYRTFKDEKCLYFLTEYLPGGQLFDLGRVKESAARFYIACVVEALDCLHAQNVVHNDLKPENLVMDAQGYAKLIDFGAAQEVKRGRVMYDFIGTYAYMPPEATRSFLRPNQSFPGLDRASDLWALGIILYFLITGENPFVTNNDNATTCKNASKGLAVVSFGRKLFSEDAEDFIRRLCAEVPSSRMGYKKIQEIRQHRWFEDFPWVELRERKLKPPMVPRVSSVIDTRNFYNERSSDLDDVTEDGSRWDRHWDRDF